MSQVLERRSYDPLLVRSSYVCQHFQHMGRNVFGRWVQHRPEVGEWQLEIRKAHDDPHDVDELVLHIAPNNGADLERLKDKIRNRFQREVELTPNRIEIHPLEDMLRRIKLETSLKEVRILDARPKI